MIVLYKKTLKESSSVRSLNECYLRDKSLADKLSILIFDNSPEEQQLESIDWKFGSVEYRHDASNGGLLGAYNCALAEAKRLNIDWLLLLDQDSTLELGLFSALFRELGAPPAASICAFVPRLVQDGAVLSPQIVGKFRNRSVASHFSGICTEPVTALNSAACLKVQAVIEAGGFPREYWLDYLDHAMFRRLQIAGGRVWCLDVSIQHDLSLRNMEEMGMSRYANVLAAEWMFIRETGWRWGSSVHRLRLLKRGLIHFLRLRDRGRALQAWRSLFS